MSVGKCCILPPLRGRYGSVAHLFFIASICREQEFRYCGGEIALDWCGKAKMSDLLVVFFSAIFLHSGWMISTNRQGMQWGWCDLELLANMVEKSLGRWS